MYVIRCNNVNYAMVVDTYENVITIWRTYSN